MISRLIDNGLYKATFDTTILLILLPVYQATRENDSQTNGTVSVDFETNAPVPFNSLHISVGILNNRQYQKKKKKRKIEKGEASQHTYKRQTITATLCDVGF